MSKFPLVWYPKDGAENVVTQIICTDEATFTRLGIKENSQQAIQVLSGPVVINGQRLTAYVIDSPADASLKPLEGLKGDGTMTFTFEAPTGATPEAGIYFLNLMQTPLDKQPALAAAINAYLRGIFYCPDHKPVFHHIAQAKEDPEILVSLQGWPTEEAGWHYWNHKNHWDFAPAIMPHILKEIVGKFESALRPARL